MVSFWVSVALALVVTTTSSSTLSSLIPWLTTSSSTGGILTAVSSFQTMIPPNQNIPNHHHYRRRRRRRPPLTQQQQGRKNPRLDLDIFMIGTGFSFDDGEQILVSVQKPLGLILEQQYGDGDESTGPKGGGGEVYVADVDMEGSAGRAGVESGDVLVAVQNTSVELWDLEDILQLIGESPAVVNLRFKRGG